MKNKNGIPFFNPKPKKVKVKYVVLHRKKDESIITPYNHEYIKELKKEGWYIVDSFHNVEVEGVGKHA